MSNATKAAATLAAQNGLDLDKITGTGKDEQITIDDVKRTLDHASNAMVSKPEFDQTDSSTWIDPDNGLTMDTYRIAADLARKGDVAVDKGQTATEHTLFLAARVFMAGVERSSTVWNPIKDGLPDALVKVWKAGLKNNMHAAYANGKVQTNTLKQYETRVTKMMMQGITPGVTKLRVPCVRYLPKDSEGNIGRVLEHADLTVNSINDWKAGHWVEGKESTAGLWAPSYAQFVADPAATKSTIEAKVNRAKGTSGAPSKDEGADETSEMLKDLTADECTTLRQVTDLVRDLDKRGDREYADSVLKEAFAELQARLHELTEGKASGAKKAS